MVAKHLRMMHFTWIDSRTSENDDWKPGFYLQHKSSSRFFSLPPTLEGSRNRGPFSEAPL